MTFRNTLRELLRTPRRTLLFLLLLALSAALLTVGANLFGSSSRARREVSGQYKTVGSIRQMPDSTRTVAVPGSAIGGDAYFYDQPEYTTVIPEDLFDGLPTKLPVENRPALFTTGVRENGEPLQLPFRLSGKLIVTFLPSEEVDGTDEAFLETHFSYSGGFEFDAVLTSMYGEPVREGEGKCRLIWPLDAPEGAVNKLQAGKEYTACASPGYGSGEAELVFFLQQAPELRSAGKTQMEISYLDQVAYETAGDFSSTEAGRLFAAYQENGEIQRSLAQQMFLTVPTRSLSLLDPFYQNQVTVKYGREITEEEFESGAKVCLVPEEFRRSLEYPNAIDVGDTLELTWYGAVYGDPPSLLSPAPEFLENVFLDRPIEAANRGTYEIVGIYTSDYIGGYEAEMNLGSYQIIVPSASGDFDSVPILSGGPLQPGCCSFELENGTADEFMAAFQALGYGSLKAEIQDMGYSSLSKGLNAVSLMAAILLLAGGVSTLCLLVFFVYLQISRRKREAAIQISLGSGKKKCAAALLLSVMLVAFTGLSAGTLAGHFASSVLSRQVYEQGASSGYSRDYSDQFESSMNSAYEYRGGASPLCSLLSGLSAAAAALLLSSAFTWRALKEEPLSLLSQKENE